MSKAEGEPEQVVKNWSYEWGQKTGRAVMRRILPWKLRKNRKALELTFETFREYMVKNENGRFRATYVLFNIGFYLLIALRDIDSVRIDLLTHPDDWTRRLSARFVLLTVYEWEADKVSGQTLRDALDVMSVPDDLKKECFRVLRRLRAIRERMTTEFRGVRNATIAHREANALAQYRAIQDMDMSTVIAVAIEFSGGVREFVAVHTRIMMATNTTGAFLRQWVQSEAATPPTQS